jgi:Bacterial Ig-like domain (group 3)/FG-GAP-like repeat
MTSQLAVLRIAFQFATILALLTAAGLMPAPMVLAQAPVSYARLVTYPTPGFERMSVARTEGNNIAHGAPMLETTATSSAPSEPIVFLFFPPRIFDIGGVYSTWLDVGDVNGDGKQDVVAISCVVEPGCGAHSQVGVLLGNGDATLQTAVTYETGGFLAQSAALADLNGDGRLDIVVANCGTEFNCFGNASVGVLLGNGDGTFRPVVTYDVGRRRAYALAVADVNRDGRPDVAVATGGCPSPNCYNPAAVVVLLGNGDGSFQPPVSYDTGAASYSSAATAVAAADLDGDDKIDLVVTNCNPGRSYCDGNASVAILPGNGDGTFRTAITYFSGGTGASTVAVVDLNGDAMPDLLIGNSGTGTVGVLLGKGNLSFAPAATYNGIGQFSIYGAFSVTVADVNGDGKFDLVVGTDGVGVLLGNGDGTFGGITNYDPGSGGELATVADMNSDGRPDLIALRHEGIGILLNNNDAPSTTISLDSSPNPVTVSQPVSYSAQLFSPSGGTTKGIVAFMQGFVSQPPWLIGMGMLNNNQTSLTVPAVDYPVTRQVVAIYSGALHIASASVSNSISQRVRGTSKTVLRTSGPSLLGNAATFTATVTSQYGTIPDGEIVTFADGTTILASVPLSGQQAIFTTSRLSAGGRWINAKYVGGKFAPSTARVWQTVNRPQTTTSLTSSLNPAIYGQKVTFTARVTGSGLVPPSGTVVFLWKYFTTAYTIGSATLNSVGVASLTKSNLNANPFSMIAVYQGNTSNLSSTSPVLNQTVLSTTSAAALTSSMNPSTVGHAITFSAKITSPTVMPTGPVTFSLGQATLGTAQLSGGKATFTTSSLPAGSNVIKVMYNGNSNITRSSAAVTQVVQP